MAIGDYILCCKCGCKLIYDGDRAQRDWWEQRWGHEPKIECPDCKQPEQEPVAWYCKEGLKRGVSLWQENPEWRPLYTAPPRREWQGLTLEEFDEIHDRSDTMHEAMVDVVKKLREKNT